METAIAILRVFELIACIAGISQWKGIRGSAFKWFSVYLAFIVVAEMIGQYLNKPGYEQLNLAFFDYFEIPVEFLFFFWLFYVAETNRKDVLPVLCGIVYVICWVIDVTYLSKYKLSFSSFSYTVGNLLMLILILRYFVQLVTSENILNFRKDMLFWICTGLLLYYLGTFPYYGLKNTLWHQYPQLFVTYSYVVYALDSLMYLMFTFSFVWGRPSSKSS